VAIVVAVAKEEVHTKEDILEEVQAKEDTLEEVHTIKDIAIKNHIQTIIADTITQEVPTLRHTFTLLQHQL
jgi:hypothetical protein